MHTECEGTEHSLSTGATQEKLERVRWAAELCRGLRVRKCFVRFSFWEGEKPCQVSVW